MRQTIKALFSWVAENREWVFSGIGVAILAVAWRIVRRVTQKRPSARQPVQAQQPPPSSVSVFDQRNQQVESQANVAGNQIAAGRDVLHAERDINIIQPPSPPLQRLHQIPPPAVTFTGREKELAQLRRVLERPGGGSRGAAISGIRGMGGIGKTELAKALAHELRELYPDAQILVALKGAHPKGEQALSPSEALAHVARSFHPDAKLPEKQEELRALYYSVLEGKRAFLLLDNALDAAQMAPLLPPPGCAVVVTSRWSFSVPGLEPLNLDTLDPEEARALLLRIAPRIRDHEGEIAQLCGCLPLALCLAAGALAARENLAPGDYIRQLRDRKARLAALDRYRGATEQELGVEASLDMSYEWLGEDLRKLWRALAVFPGTFHTAGAAAVWEMPPGAAEERLGDLLACHTVQWNKETERYSLHDLARDYAAAKLSEGERAEAEHRHAIYYCQVLSQTNSRYLEGGDGVLQGLALFDRERENIRAGQAWAAAHAGHNEVATRLGIAYPGLGESCLALRLHPREWIAWLEPALTAARKLGDRRGEGCALGNLGLAYADLDDPRRAIEFYEQALDIDCEIGDRRGKGNSLANLGNVYTTLGDPHHAIEFYEQALAIAHEFGDRHGEGNVLGNLGIAYAAIGENRRAIEFCEQYLAITREIGDRRGEGAALGNLGLVYADLGETRRAIEYHEQALAIDREIGNRLGEGAALGNLGLAYADLGEIRRAIEFHEQALAIDREIGDRRGEGNALGSLGVAYGSLGDSRRAIEYHEQALAIDREIGNRRGERNALGNLGIAYKNLGDSRRAIEYHEQALAIAREIGARQGEGTALGNLGIAYAVLGDPHRSIKFFEQALAIDREIGDRRGEGQDLGNLGSVYDDLGNSRLAIEFYEQHLTITREIGNRRGEGNALGNLGVAYGSLGDSRRAIELHEQALAIAREFGNRMGEGNALGNLGNAYSDLGDPRRAIEFYEQYLAIAREIGDRRGEGAALGNLGIAYKNLGDPHRAIEFYERDLAIARKIGDRRGEGKALFNRDLALDKLGRRDEAIASARDALAILGQIEDPAAARVRKKLQDWGALPR